MDTDRFKEADLQAGRRLIHEGKIGQILFSEGTYQIEVLDEETFWPFLQIEDSGRILDQFCTCTAAEGKGNCFHLAAAYLKIYNQMSEPLHVRFRHSLWNQLCQIASKRHGYDTSELKKEKSGVYRISSVTGKRLFQLQAESPEGRAKLQEILDQRAEETEETSLKFSNLSADELALWKQGRPSHHLCYELSFWSDLAKWWMLLQEKGTSYAVQFLYKESPLPKWIEIVFGDCLVGIYLAEVNWPELIPALATVKTPLFVEEFSYQKIQEIRYDPVDQVFLIDFAGFQDKEKKKGRAIEGIVVGEWVYVPKKGFYAGKIDPCLSQPVIPAFKVGSVLHKHPQLIQKYLKETKISWDPVKPRYHLFFDAQKNLHLNCYLFEPGDLQKARSACFGDWVYIENLGFYHLENLSFEGVKTIIPKEKVANFVNRHKHWLQAYEGFQTHVSSVESPLSYVMDQEGSLRLESRLDLSEEGEEILDFDNWIYIKGRGFYAKSPGPMGTSLQAGMTIAPSDISRFIHFYREELETIPHFFASHSPLERAGLDIHLNQEGRIAVVPRYFFYPGFSPERVRFFGDFSYVEGQGFYEISAEYRLLDGYQETKIVDPASEPYFIAYELELLKPYILTLDPRLTKPKTFFLRVRKLRKNTRSKRRDFLAELEYVSEIGAVSAIEVWKALHENKGYLFSKAGLLFLKPSRFSWLKGINKRRWLKQGRQLNLGVMEWLRLTVFENVLPTAEDAESCALIEKLQTFDASEPLDLTGLKSDLRAYQETGARWLWFLCTHGLSGLLCDEMGLGKTHQAMALLAASSNAHGGKYLVVCPTSVIYHWEGLLAKFLPSLRVRVFFGVRRSLEEFEKTADVLLTSYGTLRSERKALSKLEFEIAIFDEVQIAKNAKSQTHRALSMMDAKMRLGLTGTPIENRLIELKALFDLTVPGYLPSRALFKEMFVNPIEKGQDPEKKALLSKLIHPFILRRKKSEVLLELPEKTEEIAYCDLSEEQHELYKKVFNQHKDQLLQELSKEEGPIPYVHVFSLLSQLKQICDHPCLITKNVEHYRQHASGKWDLFTELLAETRESRQKLVVFSQYLLMLDIIKAYLKEHKIGFAEIRGSTRDRRAEMDRFREDPQCEVFVASLQAAGVGIDLVAASVVIHYDRWWNPARENQATDRVHRMGQNRGVQVFKMVTKNTIEEHIHELIESKMALVEGILGFDDQDQIKGLDREELLHLLEQIHKDIL